MEKSWITISFLFFAVVKLLSMIVIIFVGVPLVAAILFRLLVPVFIVDMRDRGSQLVIKPIKTMLNHATA